MTTRNRPPNGAPPLRATRRLLKAEELTVSYLDGSMALSPLNVRRSILEAKFGFKCQCYRCKVGRNAVSVVLVGDLPMPWSSYKTISRPHLKAAI